MIVSGEQWRDSTIHIQTSVSHAGVPTPCDPMDCSLPGSFVHGILQARILEWVAISFSRGSSRPRYQTRVSCIAGRFFTIWAARKAHLCIHVFILPKTPLLSRLPHNIEQSSMCYTVGPYWLSILNIDVYMSVSNSLTIPSSHPPHWQPLVHSLNPWDWFPWKFCGCSFHYPISQCHPIESPEL